MNNRKYCFSAHRNSTDKEICQQCWKLFSFDYAAGSTACFFKDENRRKSSKSPRLCLLSLFFSLLCRLGSTWLCRMHFPPVCFCSYAESLPLCCSNFAKLLDGIRSVLRLCEQFCCLHTCSSFLLACSLHNLRIDNILPFWTVFLYRGKRDNR